MYQFEQTTHLRDRAEDFLAKALNIDDEHSRAAYLHMADSYLALADNEEAVTQAIVIRQIALHPPL